MKIDDVLKISLKDEQQRLFINLRYTSNFFGNLQTAYMLKFGLSMPQFNILRILRGAKTALSVNTVKERMIEKSPNTTRLLDKLIDKGMIERKRCGEDKRIYFIQICDKGLQLLQEIDDLQAEKPFINSNLSDAEAKQLNELLDKLRNPYE